MNKLLSKKYLIISSIFFATAFFLFSPVISLALEYASADFKLVDEASTYGGGYSVSTDYKMESALGYVNSSTSTATSYQVSPFLLYYPTITVPVVSPTPGDSQVSLSWTASLGEQGWNVAGYNVGVSTVSGGPYTFSSSLGNVLSSTRTGLSNGTLYYFVVRVEDAFTNIVAISGEVSATPVAGVTPPPGGGGGGGGWLPPMIIPPVVPVTPVATTTPEKPVCKAYMTKSIKLGAANDPAEVRKLQTFLKTYEGFTNLAVTGFYDQSSYDAVKKFQAKYTSDILTPVGLTLPSGIVLNSTLKKINEIYCQKTGEAQVAPVTPVTPEKPVCKAYMTKSIKLGAANDPAEVRKLQTFLKTYEGFTNLAVTGFYDQSSYDAVKKFQAKYTSDILTPVGLTLPSGIVLNSTLKKINEIYCLNTTVIIPPVVPVTPVATTTPEKPVCKAYMTKSIKLGAANDPAEVRKLQTFLKTYEGFTNLAVTGFYDQSSYDAVKKFQAKYTSDILTPVGLTLPSGIVLNSTLKKINEIYCQKTAEAIAEPTFVSVTPTPISKLSSSIMVSIASNTASIVNFVPATVKNISDNVSPVVLSVANFLNTIWNMFISIFK